jgi:RNA polymerase sigma-70 factor (ECF subfamily)
MHPEDSILLQWYHTPSTREKGFTALVTKYQQPLYWHIRRMVIQHADADDVLQNVFLKVWKGLEGFREESNLYTWLYRIATNESLSFLDREKRRGVVNMDEEGVNPAAQAQLKADPHFDENKLEWKLQMAIQQLPEKQKVVFNLRYFDEMGYREMSEVLATSEGALKASYHHAVKKIEEILRES